MVGKDLVLELEAGRCRPHDDDSTTAGGEVVGVKTTQAGHGLRGKPRERGAVELTAVEVAAVEEEAAVVEAVVVEVVVVVAAVSAAARSRPPGHRR